MEEISVSEFKATCLKIIERVRRTGEQLLITKNGEPAALLIPPPIPAKKDLLFGMLKDTVEITGDIVSPLDVKWDVLK